MYVLDINQFSRFRIYSWDTFEESILEIKSNIKVHIQKYLLIFFYLLRYKQFNFTFDKARWKKNETVLFSLHWYTFCSFLLHSKQT